MKIYFMRHGVTELNKQGRLNGQIDEPLAPEGFEQARGASKLIPPSVTHIYASSMLRTMQTAEMINERLGLPLVSVDGLREMHMGSVAGHSWEKFNPKLKNLHRSMQFDYRNDGGESADEFRKRVTSFLSDINGQHADHEALVVAHGGVLRLLDLLEHGEANQGELENAVLRVYDVDQILKNY